MYKNMKTSTLHDRKKRTNPDISTTGSFKGGVLLRSFRGPVSPASTQNFANNTDSNCRSLHLATLDNVFQGPSLVYDVQSSFVKFYEEEKKEILRDFANLVKCWARKRKYLRTYR